jgi:hypothetical protein
MKNGQKKRAEGPKFLSGWKEIARYLGKGVRTVQRYERELGFPVRRPAGKSHAAVIATKAEVDAWVAASPIREEFRLSRVKIDSPLANLEDLKRRMETMGALRDQMAALRLEFRASVQNLAESIEGMHGEIDNHWRGNRKTAEAHSDSFTGKSLDSDDAHDLTRYVTPGKAS